MDNLNLIRSKNEKIQVLKSMFFFLTVPQKSEDKEEIAQTYYTVYFKTCC